MAKTSSPSHSKETASAQNQVGEGPEIVDVWSRTGRKYRIRAVVLLAVNAILFAGVGSFAFWLRSGVRFAPTMDGYWDQVALTFSFYRQTGVTLAALLLDPISVQDVPMQIPILGLLMAALIAIPILVAILYRFWACIPFLMVVAFLAVMPWLGITLLGSCALASIRPFKARIRFVSALIGLVPMVVYFTLAWSGSGEAIAGVIDPVDKIKFLAPWVLAVVAAALLSAIVLTIARFVDYRPGAITPLLALMFGLPVGLFEAHVGRDELYYRLIESLDRDHFSDIDASVGLHKAAEMIWAHSASSGRNLQDARARAEQVWQFALTDDISGFQSVLTSHQAELVDRCDRFLKYFPASRYAPNTLFIKARALDMRIDPTEFRLTKWIRFYDDYPSPASVSAWEELVAIDPDSILAAVGNLRLALVYAREGKVERARDHVAKVIDNAEPDARALDEQSGTEKAGIGEVFTKEAASVTLHIELEQIALEAHRLSDLLASNRDPVYGWDPLSGSRRPDAKVSFGLLDLVPRDDRYAHNIMRLVDAYPNCQLADNFELEIAKADHDEKTKIRRLENLLYRYPQRDAVPEAIYRLAVAYQRANQPQQSAVRFAQLIRDYGGTAWARQAKRHGPRATVINGHALK